MANFNKVILVGNLTRDPEKRVTDGGTTIVNMSIAVNKRVKKVDRYEDEANFFDIVCFGNTADNCAKFLAKGRPVLVEGELVQRRWEAKDGTKRSKVEVSAFNVQFLGGKDGDGARGGSGGGGGGRRDDVHDEPQDDLFDDDIPF